MDQHCGDSEIRMSRKDNGRSSAWRGMGRAKSREHKSNLPSAKAAKRNGLAANSKRVRTWRIVKTKTIHCPTALPRAGHNRGRR